MKAFSDSLIKYSCYLTLKSYKMVDNKSKTSLIGHIQKKYITHEDLQYNTCAAHSFNIIVIFICDKFFLYMSFGKFSYCIIIDNSWLKCLEIISCFPMSVL